MATEVTSLVVTRTEGLKEGPLLSYIIQQPADTSFFFFFKGSHVLGIITTVTAHLAPLDILSE